MWSVWTLFGLVVKPWCNLSASQKGLYLWRAMSGSEITLCDLLYCMFCIQNGVNLVLSCMSFFCKTLHHPWLVNLCLLSSLFLFFFFVGNVKIVIDKIPPPKKKQWHSWRLFQKRILQKKFRRDFGISICDHKGEYFEGD